LQDSTFEFERKRNRPERYDRNVTENTLKAIKTIDKVRSRREAKHIERRLFFSPSGLCVQKHNRVMSIISLVTFKFLQKERKEGAADERGSKGASAEHQLSQSPSCPQRGSISYSSKDHGQGIPTTGEPTHGRMSPVMFLISGSRVVEKEKEERKKKLIFSLLFFFFFFFFFFLLTNASSENGKDLN
jgi:hypothetical protein